MTTPRKARQANARRKPAALPVFVAPCLARLTDAPPEGEEWAHEIKFDGYRLQVAVSGSDARIYTRSGLDWTHRFPSLAKAALQLKVETALIDGEAVILDEHGASSFTALVDALSHGRDAAIVLMAFDLLALDSEDLRPLSLVERKRRLQTLLARRKPAAIRYSEHVIGNGTLMLAEAKRLNLEGIVSKRVDKPYSSGRRGDWLKAKCISTDEFVIAGYVDSTAMANAIGSLVLGAFRKGELIYAGRVGTGFDTSTARSLWSALKPLRRASSPFAVRLSPLQLKGVRWVEPELVAVRGRGAPRRRPLEERRREAADRHARRADPLADPALGSPVERQEVDAADRADVDASQSLAGGELERRVDVGRDFVCQQRDRVRHASHLMRRRPGTAACGRSLPR